ncbi:MAG: hypothetical protein EOO01_03535 [Chitinophagaceae bacterium]|nr:MAG: hypothetical protein EOO01_03535 [Chitinophagaceae bacterium]
MKLLFMLCMLLPVLGSSQSKNVVSVNRLFPKADKVLEFEKALAAHAQKYHKGDWRWNVFSIESGPDAGGYHITEGPASWDAIDARGDLGADHNNDWNRSIAIYLTDRTANSYSAYQEDLSTVKLEDYAEKIAITHYYPKIGWGDKMKEMIGKMKKVWEAGGQSIAVYTSSSSGPFQYAVVTRYKQGLKERNDGFRKPLKERYEAVYGAGSWKEVDDFFQQYVDKAWGELLFMRKDLSSK